MGTEAPRWERQAPAWLCLRPAGTGGSINSCFRYVLTPGLLKTLTEYVRGWMGYFGISDFYRSMPELELVHWPRRRICMCYWNQWHGVRTVSAT